MKCGAVILHHINDNFRFVIYLFIKWILLLHPLDLPDGGEKHENPFKEIYFYLIPDLFFENLAVNFIKLIMNLNNWTALTIISMLEVLKNEISHLEQL